MSNIVLEVKDLKFSYQDKSVLLQGLNFTLNEGDRLFLSGPSGSGKTSLIRLILGLNKPDSGKVAVSPDIRLSVVFQDDRLIPSITLLENIQIFNPAASKQVIQALLEELGILSYQDYLPSELSGGIKRRAQIALALASNASLTILDEAFVGLDENSLVQTANVVDKYIGAKSLILVSHNPILQSMLHCNQELSL